MKKIEMIKKLVCEYAKSFGIGSQKHKDIFIKQDYIVAQIDSKWYKEIITREYEAFMNNEKDIVSIFNLLTRNIKGV